MGGGIAMQLLGGLLLVGTMGSCFYGLAYARPTYRAVFLTLSVAQLILGFVLLWLGGRHLRGTPLSLGDKAAPEPSEPSAGECREADDALKYAIFGLFCFGFILGPAAIAKALKARKVIAAKPLLKGEGKATAGLIIGIIALLLWLLVITVQIAART